MGYDVTKVYEQTTTTITTNHLKMVVCDCCKKEFDPEEDIFSIQDMIHIEHLGGYASGYGDGVKVTADFCHSCAEKLFGNYLKRTNAW